MATYTSHLNLKLPDYSDTADIKDLNDNFRKIDEAIDALSDGSGSSLIVNENGEAVILGSMFSVDDDGNAVI